MVILGLIDSKPSAAAVMVGERVVSAVAEERLSRMKMANGTPRQAIEAAMSVAGVEPDTLDHVAIAQHTLAFRPEPTSWDGWFAPDEVHARQRGLKWVSARVAPWLGQYPVASRAHQAIKQLLLRDRRRKLPALLRDAYGITAPVRFYDHHYCHATSAYYASNMESALVLTMDGGGDGRSASVYVGRGGVLERLSDINSYHSLGNFYSYVTALCGFKAEKHEGKITGLAALGRPRYVSVLREFLRYQAPGQIRYTVPMYHQSALSALRKRLPRGFERADLAASAQLLLEELAAEFVRYWARKTGLRRVAVAGGVFANVKLNQHIHALPEIDEFFVYPAMDDSGLAAGAAFAAAAEGHPQPERLLHRLPHVYLGNEYSGREVDFAVERSGHTARTTNDIHAEIATLLAQGQVVARFTGRMEYGPRALGHRSILYQTTDVSVNDWLNERLQRTEFMPFAPATLADHTTSCYEGLSGATDPARFMTITCNCTSLMKRQSPGVVHVDGTARPQLVDRETAPDLHAILNAYHRRTGLPSLINTSFNMHEEPIVCSPNDALRAFDDGRIDYLAMDNLLLRHPACDVRHPRKVGT